MLSNLNGYLSCREVIGTYCFADSLSGEFESSCSKNTYTVSSISSQVSLIENISFAKFLSSSGSSGSTLPDLVIEKDQTWMKAHPTAMRDIKRMTSIMERQRKEKTRNDWRKKFIKKTKYHGAVFCNHETNSELVSFCDRCTNQFRVEINDFFDTLPKPSAGSVLRIVESD